MANKTAEENFAALNLGLPKAPEPLGLYKPAIISGSYLYVSGHGPLKEDGSFYLGCVGQELDMDQGKEAARQVALTMLATIRSQLGSLNKIRRVIKVLGLVNCTADFYKHPYVINGFSEILRAVWGEELGVGARSAVGVPALPDNIAVEVEAIFELEP